MENHGSPLIFLIDHFRVAILFCKNHLQKVTNCGQSLQSIIQRLRVRSCEVSGSSLE